jgi:hypothetical protein
MERKLATNTSSVGSQPRIHTGADERRGERCSLGPVLLPVEDAQAGGTHVTVSGEWIAWWLNLRLK